MMTEIAVARFAVDIDVTLTKHAEEREERRALDGRMHIK
jgi:hypothetical protein